MWDLATHEPDPGMYCTSLDEIEEAFAWSYSRRQLIKELRWLEAEFRAKYVRRYWLDGSFMTSKDRPRDVDVIYSPPLAGGIDSWGLLSPAQRKVLKKAHKIDLWPFPSPQPKPGGKMFETITILEYFATDEDDNPKALAQIDI